jgi:hypothetical protein
MRKPSPKQVVHPGAANANVSDLVQNIFVLNFWKKLGKTTEFCCVDVTYSLVVPQACVNDFVAMLLGQNPITG